ncbi:mitochondrial zinc maintenance protein 1, mitochondrial [Polytolypa hystricis UAMH7299]|uniref:Mitochondrial zinc maintenance protein 1, mitochondrial n=1 Tax=Polytolypa hystricis (strain UAMH7299) TaxID=1447883 RepID=A0A2B7XT44_POLH7|nr:mitochondrial zinc maintenance protein 1, mitochondrial [Polytolypa hystricis UAMH7299]
MATPAVSAIGAYRNLLRATRIAFQGDYRILYAARAEARKQFDANRREGIDTPMKIQHALETAQILKTNLVQGQRVESVDENGQTKEKYGRVGEVGEGSVVYVYRTRESFATVVVGRFQGSFQSYGYMSTLSAEITNR